MVRPVIFTLCIASALTVPFTQGYAAEQPTPVESTSSSMPPPGAGSPEGDVQRPTVTFDRALHFIAAEGSDVPLPPGIYGVEQAGQERLRLVPGKSQPPIEIQATSIAHDESLSAPVSLAVIEEGQDDQVHVVFLLPSGQGLDAMGSFTGTRSRGTVSALSAVQVQTAVAQSKLTTQQMSVYLTVPVPGSRVKGRQPAAPATTKGKWITWNYLYMNHPEIVAQALAEVQAGKRPLIAVSGLASTTELNDMLKTNWSAEVAKMTATQRGVTTRGVDAIYESQTSASSTIAAAFPLPTRDLGHVWSGQRSTTTIMVTVPFDGYIEALFKLESARRRFRIVNLVSYTGEFVHGQPVVAQQAQGGRYEDIRPKGGADRTLISMAGFASINVKARQQVAVTVAFEPDPGAGPPVGNYQESLELNAFGTGGGHWARTVPIRASSNGINFGVLFYPEQGHAATLTNQTVEYPIVITNAAGTPALASLTAQALPPGVTMDPLNVSVPGQATLRQTLRFHVTDAAPDGSAQPIVVRLNSGGQVRSVDLSMSIYHPFLFWCESISDSPNCDYIPGVGDQGWLIKDGVHVRKLKVWVQRTGEIAWFIDMFNGNDPYVDIGGTDFRVNLWFRDEPRVSDAIEGNIGPSTTHQYYSHNFVHGWIADHFLTIADRGLGLRAEKR